MTNSAMEREVDACILTVSRSLEQVVKGFKLSQSLENHEERF